MSALYSDLAKVYEAMYATFIDYKKEYRFYSTLLKHDQKEKVLEIGCGTGNLAFYFHENGYSYTGLDISSQMIAIARKKNLGCEFIVDDIRSFTLKHTTKNVLMTGRTISYLTHNKDIIAAFSNIYKNLDSGGLFCFDCIDASSFIPEISKGKKITHEATYKGIHYVRKSTWTPTLVHGMDFQWESEYYKRREHTLMPIGTDTSTIRTFSRQEIEIFLTLVGFKVIDIIEKESYAFPTFVIVAEKT